MKYTVDTVNKTIEIEDATIEEVVKLAKKYKKYRVVSMQNITYPYYTPWTPYWDFHPITIEPFYVTSVGTTAFSATTGDSSVTYKTDVPFTLTN